MAANNVCLYTKEVPAAAAAAARRQTPGHTDAMGAHAQHAGDDSVRGAAAVAATTVSVLWRCSVNTPAWKAAAVDSIDFATYVLGYSTNFLPQGFFGRYTA